MSTTVTKHIHFRRRLRSLLAEHGTHLDVVLDASEKRGFLRRMNPRTKYPSDALLLIRLDIAHAELANAIDIARKTAGQYASGDLSVDPVDLVSIAKAELNKYLSDFVVPRMSVAAAQKAEVDVFIETFRQ